MAVSESNLIFPGEVFPESVGACFTQRTGGISSGSYKSLNLAKHVGDDDETVDKNRQSVLDFLGIRQQCWLTQVHGNSVVVAEASEALTADASWTDKTGLACTIQVADCMSVLISDSLGQKVGAAHAGWRGLCCGVIPNLLQAMKLEPAEACIWLGPCIGQKAFEVGPEVLDAFSKSSFFSNIDLDRAFVSGLGDRLHADLQHLARMQLLGLGYTNIAQNPSCTHSDSARFFSFRRDGTTGRMAALIWIKPS